jgi:hypothetical protein
MSVKRRFGAAELLAGLLALSLMMSYAYIFRPRLSPLPPPPYSVASKELRIYGKS